MQKQDPKTSATESELDDQALEQVQGGATRAPPPPPPPPKELDNNEKLGNFEIQR